jgi:hypothetical protein
MSTSSPNSVKSTGWFVGLDDLVAAHRPSEPRRLERKLSMKVVSARELTDRLPRDPSGPWSGESGELRSGKGWVTRIDVVGSLNNRDGGNELL